jgi:hypothetical protein
VLDEELRENQRFHAEGQDADSRLKSKMRIQDKPERTLLGVPAVSAALEYFLIINVDFMQWNHTFPHLALSLPRYVPALSVDGN